MGSEVSAILSDLIAAPSPNPPGDCEAVAGVCVRWLAELDIAHRVVRAQDGTPSVIASLGQGERRLLVHSHYDTQPPGELAAWNSDPYMPVVRDGNIYGRGAGDDKGSVSAQLAALRALKRSGFAPEYEVRFAFVADEESGGERGTAFLLEAGELDCDLALVGEQTDNRLAIGERGMAWIRVTFHGRAAHGAIPEAGVSAALPAARFVTMIDDELLPALPARRPSGLLPASSANVGRIAAGIDISIVAERAEVDVDRRIVPGESVESAVAEVERFAARAVDRHPGVSVSITPILQSPAFLTPSDHAFVQTCQLAVAEVGGSPELTGYQQSSDARYLAARSVPFVIFGPSDPRVGHAPNEHVAINDLRTASAAIERIARTVSFAP